jgi:hypothetical protein
MVAVAAAPIALSVLRRFHRTKAPSAAAIDTAVTAEIGSMIDPRFHAAVHTAASAAVRAVRDAAPPGARLPRTDARKGTWVELPLVPAPKALHVAVGRCLYFEVFREIFWALLDAVENAVHHAIHHAVAVSVPGKWSPDLLLRSYAWLALVAFFRDEVKVPLDDPLWQHNRAHQDTCLTHWWWPTNDFVMVCDRPAELHIERAGDSHRLHNDAGPAIRWADGWGIHFWHGTRVPADLIETGWSAERILAERNAEIRRCAIERVGWDQFASAAGLRLLDEAPDPANPGRWLSLYDVPRKLLNQRMRVLLCANATRERDGTRRSFGLTVPASCRTALAAAAWTFDIPEAEYTNLARAT